jgi:hypothetical protein
VCGQNVCGFTTFIPENLVLHEVENHMDTAVDKPDHQVVIQNEAVGKTDPALYTRKPYEVTYTSFKCFVCNDGIEYNDIVAFDNHLQSAHSSPSPKGFVTTCLFCQRKFASDNRRKDAHIVFGAMLCHMVDMHNYPEPLWVEKLRCTQSGCDYFTFTADNLASHLKVFHAVIDVKLAKCKKKTFYQNKQPHKSYVGKSVIKLREFRCFLCDDQVAGSTVREYVSHWKNTHIQLHQRVFRFNCHLCSHEYTVPLEKQSEPSIFMIRISYFFIHLVHNHSFAVPGYVVPYSCEISKCTFVTYTYSHLDNHCKNAHLMSAEDMVLQTEELPTTVTITFDENAANFKEYLPSQNDLANMPDGSHVFQMEKSEDGVQLETVVEVKHLAPSCMCLICNKVFTSLAARRKHIKEMHERNSKKHVCSECAITFHSQVLVDQHLLTAHNVVAKNRKCHSCHLCDFKSIHKSVMNHHTKVSHSFTQSEVQALEGR